MEAGGWGSAMCSSSHTPTAGAGTHTIKADYAASDSVHTNSNDAGGSGLTVTTRATSTSVTGCSPATVAINQPSTCTAKVTDTDLGSKSAPLGTVSFSSSGTGGFSGSPCTLVAGGPDYSSCTVSYTPTAGAGTHTIKADYAASDSVHTIKSDAGRRDLPSSPPRPSSSLTGCSPATVAINQPSTCTAKVTDTDLGSKS